MAEIQPEAENAEELRLGPGALLPPSGYWHLIDWHDAVTIAVIRCVHKTSLLLCQDLHPSICKPKLADVILDEQAVILDEQAVPLGTLFNPLRSQQCPHT